MGASASVDLWDVLPRSLRRAGMVAVVTLFAAAALLYQSSVRTTVPPDFSRGGDFAGAADGPFADVKVTTPTPRAIPSGESRSSATLQARDQPDDFSTEVVGSPRFPAFGRYIYTVEGTESATAFGSREYPPEMTMTVHRSEEDPEQKLRPDELAFDLFFSEEHEEREIVAFRRKGLFFTYEAGSVTFGPVTQTSEANYSPAMLQVPAPIEIGAVHEGTSRAISPEGEERRVEDWAVTVKGHERIEIMDEDVDTWIVEIKRQSRPGSAEQVTRTRTYWLDPQRSIWVKWEEDTSGTQDFGPGTFTYTTEFTATLDRIDPL